MPPVDQCWSKAGAQTPPSHIELSFYNHWSIKWWMHKGLSPVGAGDSCVLRLISLLSLFKNLAKWTAESWHFAPVSNMLMKPFIETSLTQKANDSQLIPQQNGETQKCPMSHIVQELSNFPVMQNSMFPVTWNTSSAQTIFLLVQCEFLGQLLGCWGAFCDGRSFRTSWSAALV